MLAWPPVTGTAPSADPSTENATVPVAGTPVDVLSTATTVDPAGSGVTVRARVAVAATGAAGVAADDDAAEEDTAAGDEVPTDSSVPLPLVAGPQATRANDNAPAARMVAVVRCLLVFHRRTDIGWPPSSGQSNCRAELHARISGGPEL